MLEKSRISTIAQGTEQWKFERLGKFTSSNIYKIMGERGIGEMGISYIETRVGEYISGVSSESDILNEAIAHGNTYEIECLRHFKRIKSVDFLVTQKMVYGLTKQTSSTPDALFVRQETLDELYYDVSTVEAKAFQMAHHMKCLQCETPLELKEKDPKTFWQVIDQMLVIDCLDGYAVFYHPDFKLEEGGIHIIHFKKLQSETVNGKTVYPLRDKFVELQTRKEQALDKFNEILKKIKGIKIYLPC